MSTASTNAESRSVLTPIIRAMCGCWLTARMCMPERVHFSQAASATSAETATSPLKSRTGWEIVAVPGLIPDDAQRLWSMDAADARLL